MRSGYTVYEDVDNPNAKFIEIPFVITPNTVVYMNAMLDSAQIWVYSYHIVWSSFFDSNVSRLHVMRMDGDDNFSTNIIRTVILSYTPL